MVTNIGAVSSGSSTLTVGGGNLYTIAADRFGDPMAWTALAQANKITDPQVAGITTLIVPPSPTVASGGVLNA